MLGSTAQYLLKLGMKNFDYSNGFSPTTFINSIALGPLTGGIVCYGLSLVFWLVVLSKLELSKAYPMVSLGYVFTLILGYWLLNEQLTITKIGGVIIIIIGVIIVTK